MLKMKLGQVLDKRGLTRMALARGVNLSPATITLLINYHKWPVRWPEEDIKKRIFAFLDDPELGEEIFEEYDPEEEESPASAATEDGAGVPDQSKADSELEAIMLLRKQALTPNTRQKF